MVAFARPALGCAHTVGFTDVFIARDGPPQKKKSIDEAVNELQIQEVFVCIETWWKKLTTYFIIDIIITTIIKQDKYLLWGFRQLESSTDKIKKFEQNCEWLDRPI